MSDHTCTYRSGTGNVVHVKLYELLPHGGIRMVDYAVCRKCNALLKRMLVCNAAKPLTHDLVLKVGQSKKSRTVTRTFTEAEAKAVCEAAGITMNEKGEVEKWQNC